MIKCEHCGEERDLQQEALDMSYGVSSGHTTERCRNNLKAQLATMTERAEKAKHALEWEDVDDEWTADIAAAHPTRSGSHDTYGTAMEMVGHRHSKGQLVSLVNWLLVRLNTHLA